MKFTPQSASEDKGREPFVKKLLPDGDYDFEVLDAVEKQDANGRDYISLKLGVWNSSGKQEWVFNNLSSADSMQWKLRHFCEAVGIVKDYETGNINAQNLIKLCGKFKVYTRKDKAGQHPDRNDVKDYIPRAVELPAQGIKQEKPPVDDDDMPF